MKRKRIRKFPRLQPPSFKNDLGMDSQWVFVVEGVTYLWSLKISPHPKTYLLIFSEKGEMTHLCLLEGPMFCKLWDNYPTFSKIYSFWWILSFYDVKEYTKELYRKNLHDPDNHDGVITHIESDILECEVKWALGSITMNKASGGDGIPVEILQILKVDVMRVLYSICQQIWKTQQWPQDWKRSVFIPVPKKGNAKECLNYPIIALISHTSKAMLQILQARLQQYMNHELPDV